jgi:two-component system sensor histidine kinase KdpD
MRPRRWDLATGVPRRRVLAGSAGALVLVGALTAAMVPLRSHMSVATSALLLVVPVVVGSAVGGFGAGAVATVVGFLVYDLVFIPPYYTLSVGAAQNWAALGVYAVVMVVVAQVVAQVGRARTEAQQRAAELRRLFDLSELLVRDTAPEAQLERIVSSVLHAFDVEGAALLLPVEGRLSLAASAGAALGEDELAHLERSARAPAPLAGRDAGTSGIRTVALSASGQPIGLLALQGGPGHDTEQELLRAFANHLALALERGQLREQALRSRLLEEVDRLRRSLVGAVSHDLRTPLATIKVSTSTLLDPDVSVPPADVEELLGLIDAQADRLERLVANLLDMTRIQSGSLELRPRAVAVGELVEEALAVLGSAAEGGRVKVEVAPDLPLVSADEILVRQVLANLIDNALRNGPEASPVTVAAARRGDGRVLVSVTDRGPGIAPSDRGRIFEMAERAEAGGRGGLGLAIARAFLEAHGQRIWVTEGEGGAGARFLFTLPVADHAGEA